MMIKRVLALISALSLFHLLNALGEPVFSYRKLSARLEFLDSVLEMVMLVFMYLTRFAFICMEGSMKPSVELLRECWLDH